MDRGGAAQAGSAAMGTAGSLAGAGSGLAAPLAVGSLLTGIGGSILGGNDQRAAQEAQAQRQLNEQTMANTAQASQAMGQPNQKAVGELNQILPGMMSGSSGLSPSSMNTKSVYDSQGYM